MTSLMTQNPRSVLHSIKPQELRTPAVESLISYFCRLAGSHSTSITALSKVVINTMDQQLNADFDWRDRNLSGIGRSAITWASALAAMTSVSRLDQLTLASWNKVLAPRGLMAPSKGKWCPHCFEEDREEGREPYLRLAWDLKAVTACDRHGTQLVCACPDCGQTGVRHKAVYVIPGWCTRCGAFFGDQPSPVAASAEAIWIAEQIGQLLETQAGLATQPTLHTLQEVITALVAQMDNGNGSAFGARIGVSRSTVHCWVQGKTALTMDTSLLIAAKTGLPLAKLLTGDLDGWEPPTLVCQLNLDLELGSRHRLAPSRMIDWDLIRTQLIRFAKQPTPISLAQAARQLELDPSTLYLHVNKEARMLSERWQVYAKRRAERNRTQAREQVKEVCKQLLEEGRALNMREVQRLMPPEELRPAKHLFDMLSEIKQELGVV